MQDLISRQAAIDSLLDEGLITAAVYVSKLPTAQPEIIKCKDCIHSPKIAPGYYRANDLEFPDDICPLQCDDPWYSQKPDDNFFCAKGERNEDE